MKLSSVNILQKGFPVLTWLPKYNSEYLISDIVGGITVGLTLIPQSIAYAALAGLTPEVREILLICPKTNEKKFF